MLDHSCGSGQHSHAERGLDCYQTPPVAVEALLRVEEIPTGVWEPCAGYGAIAQVLRNHDRAVVCSDVRDYGFRLHFRRNFLAEIGAPTGVECIVTNPPFRLAQQFIEHGLRLVPKVVMLLRLSFLESERRSPILDSGQLARVWVFRNRLPMMHRNNWKGPRASSAIAFAWFVFLRAHAGPTTLKRISWGHVATNSDTVGRSRGGAVSPHS